MPFHGSTLGSAPRFRPKVCGLAMASSWGGKKLLDADGEVGLFRPLLTPISYLRNLIHKYSDKAAQLVTERLYFYKWINQILQMVLLFISGARVSIYFGF